MPTCTCQARLSQVHNRDPATVPWSPSGVEEVSAFQDYEKMWHALSKDIPQYGQVMQAHMHTIRHGHGHDNDHDDVDDNDDDDGDDDDDDYHPYPPTIRTIPAIPAPLTIP